MGEISCTACGAELIPGTGFCRQCGAAVSGDPEGPTAILNQSPELTTQRLDPRVTNPYQEASAPASRSLPARTAIPRRPTRFQVFGVLMLGVLACVGIVQLVRNVSFSRLWDKSGGQVSRALIYPGSRIVVDIGQEGGGSVLQLTTQDPLEKVRDWYLTNFKPDKVLTATMNSAILRKDKVIITIIAEGGSTTVVIKQTG
jgi:hypothetical protein